MKIFVSVVSFRDPLLSNTIRSLLGEQSGDNEIVIGVFEQTCIEDSLVSVDKELTERQDVKYKRIDPEYADGVVWARKINAAQITDEDFIYQVDSHILYEENWDRFLIQDWELARQKTSNNKAIITSACYSFNLEDGIPALQKTAEPFTTCAKYFTFQKNLKLPAAHGEWQQKTDDVFPAIHIFAGNFFAPTYWVDEVGYDARIFFEGEEHYMVLKSFMLGWSIYHPREMHCYHYTGTHEYITKHWVDPINDKYAKLTNQGYTYWLKFINNLSEDVLHKYYEYSGVDYINCKIEERAFTRQIIDPNATGTPDSED
jgi:hypothetical protein